jgi:hypothetical protein
MLCMVSIEASFSVCRVVLLRSSPPCWVTVNCRWISPALLKHSSAHLAECIRESNVIDARGSCDWTRERRMCEQMDVNRARSSFRGKYTLSVAYLVLQLILKASQSATHGICEEVGDMEQELQWKCTQPGQGVVVPLEPTNF